MRVVVLQTAVSCRVTVDGDGQSRDTWASEVTSTTDKTGGEVLKITASNLRGGCDAIYEAS